MKPPVPIDYPMPTGFAKPLQVPSPVYIVSRSFAGSYFCRPASKQYPVFNSRSSYNALYFFSRTNMQEGIAPPPQTVSDTCKFPDIVPYLPF